MRSRQEFSGQRFKTTGCIYNPAAGEVFRNLDLDVAEISLSCRTLALFLGRVVGFGCPRRPAFQTTVPVVGYKWSALVALGRAMGVDIVNVREIGLESVERGPSAINDARGVDCSTR
jgi:hypothetical protein